MPPPRVEVGRVRLDVLVAVRHAVGVEDELVGREEDAAEAAFDALGPAGVVAGGNELAAAAPRALVVHLHAGGENTCSSCLRGEGVVCANIISEFVRTKGESELVRTTEKVRKCANTGRKQ